MADEYQLVQKISSYNSSSDERFIIKAIEFSKKAHSIQIRASGDPYFTHPLAVAHILADLKLDDASIVTGLLHDTVEDTTVDIETVEKAFGTQVAKLVEGVTKLNKIDYQPENVRQAENFRKLLLAMSKDIRILMVKIADRLHNMRTIDHIKSKDKRAKIAKETLEIYAPLTERIGMHSLKDELQDLSFAQINPDIRDSIIQRLDFLKNQGEQNSIQKIIASLTYLLDEKNIKCQIYGREKKPYSIWRKMKRKNVSFEQLSDIMAFRIIVADIEECYRILGIIHTKYHNIPGSFKDYISTPKGNGYRSLHSTIIGPTRQKVEIQIRTGEMHEIAEFGIAAHWCYKDGIDFNNAENNYKWVNELLHILELSSDPEEFIKNTRLEMYQDQVFCFSPKGDLIVLPYGATAIDFAYAIHSDVGNSCIGAKVNGIVAPVKTILRNGDQVEVISSPDQNPSELWEEFVVTGKAKTQIRKYIRSKKRDMFLNQGRNIIREYFHKQKIEFVEKEIAAILHVFSKTQLDDLLIAVGEGLISDKDIFNACYPDYENNSKSSKGFFSFIKGYKSIKKTSAIKDLEHSIKGVVPGMPIHFAQCCHPLPGDKIMGVIHAGEGITIHVSKCDNTKSSEVQDNMIKLSWSNNTKMKKMYSGKLRVIVANSFGAISTVLANIANQNVNVVDIRILHKTEAYYELLIEIELQNIRALKSLKAYLRSFKMIYSVDRI